jgi:hypothetical protein
MTDTIFNWNAVAEAIGLEAGRITYGNSYVQAMKRQGFGQAIYAQPRTWLELGRPLSFEESAR